jgi:hypothetical protein
METVAHMVKDVFFYLFRGWSLMFPRVNMFLSV